MRKFSNQLNPDFEERLSSESLNLTTPQQEISEQESPALTEYKSGIKQQFVTNSNNNTSHSQNSTQPNSDESSKKYSKEMNRQTKNFVGTISDGLRIKHAILKNVQDAKANNYQSNNERIQSLANYIKVGDEEGYNTFTMGILKSTNRRKDVENNNFAKLAINTLYKQLFEHIHKDKRSEIQHAIDTVLCLRSKQIKSFKALDAIKNEIKKNETYNIRISIICDYITEKDHEGFFCFMKDALKDSTLGEECQKFIDYEIKKMFYFLTKK